MKRLTIRGANSNLNSIVFAELELELEKNFLYSNLNSDLQISPELELG